MTAVRHTDPEGTRTYLGSAPQHPSSNRVATTTDQRTAGAGAAQRPAGPNSSIASAARNMKLAPSTSLGSIPRGVLGRRSTPTAESDMHDTTTHEIDDVEQDEKQLVEAHPAAIEEESRNQSLPQRENSAETTETPTRLDGRPTDHVVLGSVGAFFYYYYCFHTGRKSKSEATHRGASASSVEAQSLVENSWGGAS